LAVFKYSYFFFKNLYPLELLPPPQFDFQGKKVFQEKFSPFQWTGRWNLATNSGISQHFHTRLNASKSARIESREDSKTHSVAEIGKNGYFTNRGTRFTTYILTVLCSTGSPCITIVRVTSNVTYLMLTRIRTRIISRGTLD
jgi:hypothetical protein